MCDDDNEYVCGAKTKKIRSLTITYIVLWVEHEWWRLRFVTFGLNFIAQRKCSKSIAKASITVHLKYTAGLTFFRIFFLIRFRFRWHFIRYKKKHRTNDSQKNSQYHSCMTYV